MKKGETPFLFEDMEEPHLPEGFEPKVQPVSSEGPKKQEPPQLADETEGNCQYCEGVGPCMYCKRGKLLGRTGK